MNSCTINLGLVFPILDTSTSQYEKQFSLKKLEITQWFNFHNQKPIIVWFMIFLLVEVTPNENLTFFRVKETVISRNHVPTYY